MKQWRIEKNKDLAEKYGVKIVNELLFEKMREEMTELYVFGIVIFMFLVIAVFAAFIIGVLI